MDGSSLLPIIQKKQILLMEVNSSQNDKDFIAAINWKKIEEYVKNGGGTKMPANYAHNVYDEHTHTATSTMKKEVIDR